MGEKRRCIHGRTEKQRCAECNEMDALNERNHTLYTKLEAAEARVRELEEKCQILRQGYDAFVSARDEEKARAEAADEALGEARKLIEYARDTCGRPGVYRDLDEGLAALGEGSE